MTASEQVLYSLQSTSNHRKMLPWQLAHIFNWLHHFTVTIIYIIFAYFWKNLHIQDNGFIITTEWFRLQLQDLLNNFRNFFHKIRSGHNCNSSPNCSCKLRTICITFVFPLTWTPASHILVPNTLQLACIPISIVQGLQKPRFQKSTLYHSRITKM